MSLTMGYVSQQQLIIRNNEQGNYTTDGGFQMNIKIQAIAFNKLPIKIIILNNESLGNTVSSSKLFK